VEKEPYNAQQRKGLMTPGWKDEDVDTHFAQKAVAFMEGHRQASPDRPFFLYLTPSAPHRPCVPPDFMKGKSKAGPRGDMVMMVDWVVGEVMQTLDRLGLSENTLLIVTSDNGARPADVDGETHGHKSCGDLRGYKADIWDGGHRIPFVARWPGRIEPGSVCEETICLADLTATCAAIVGAPLPHDAAEDSFSILPALRGEKHTTPVRESTVHHSSNGVFALREGAWKLIMGLGSGGATEPRVEEPVPGGPLGQLYDMENDTAETANLWSEKPEIVERLAALVQKYKESGRTAGQRP
jgi:arylsulfatase A-like enzyme